ncbi:MAG TPA: 50S ribosomal protein L5 [Vicinamibacteria bacterium]|jgi:large subunit ribosomal protein L5
MSRLREHYRQSVISQLQKELGIKNIMAVPRMTKVVVNMGVGEGAANIKVLEAAMEELARITGQKPGMRRAKKSIASFKIREGNPVGTSVTLRGNRMYEFVDRLFNIALPRVRDFRGVPVRSFDGRGNFTLGLKDQLIFPEIDYSHVESTRGMNVTFCTSARNDQGARRLLELLGMPFRRQPE